MQSIACSKSIGTIVATLVTAVSLGCTTVKTVGQYSGAQLPRPDRILVYDFAYSPSQVKLDRGVSADLDRALRGTSRTEKELEIGDRLSGLVAEHLVKQLRELGLPAQRASGDAHPWGNTYSVEGQFVSIDEGNRTERVVIGLGAGRSNVEIHVQFYQDSEDGQRILENLDVTAKSGRKPGMAETMGAGAAMGTLAVSAAVSVAAAAGSETFGVNVDADASRAANEVFKHLKQFFGEQGWISGG